MYKYAIFVINESAGERTWHLNRRKVINLVVTLFLLRKHKKRTEQMEVYMEHRCNTLIVCFVEKMKGIGCQVLEMLHTAKNVIKLRK